MVKYITRQVSTGQTAVCSVWHFNAKTKILIDLFIFPIEWCWSETSKDIKTAKHWIFLEPSKTIWQRILNIHYFEIGCAIKSCFAHWNYFNRFDYFSKRWAFIRLKNHHKVIHWIGEILCFSLSWQTFSCCLLHISSLMLKLFPNMDFHFI